MCGSRFYTALTQGRVVRFACRRLYLHVYQMDENDDRVNRNSRPENVEERDPDDELSPVAVGYAWASRISTYSLELVILTLFGYWIDARYGTKPWLMLAGIAIGVYAFVSGLVVTAKRLQSPEERKRLGRTRRK